MPLTHEPPKPHRSVRDAPRVLGTISRHGTGAAPADVERDTGLPPDRLAALLEMLRAEGYVERLSDGGYVTGETLSLLGSSLNSECEHAHRLYRAADTLNRGATPVLLSLAIQRPVGPSPGWSRAPRNLGYDFHVSKRR
ncbi:hypothetical protein [Streptomyces sp. NPDC007088]|uniref:hypothetical protein n=1 Tax=Streptomyces sp. NPDC007088 TaxID=3364773 RepID=UPI0036A7C262